MPPQEQEIVLEALGRSPTGEAWHLRIVRRYKESWFDKHLRFSIPVALAAFAAALWVNFWAIGQATKRAGPSLEDIILSRTPALEVDGLFIYGTFVFIAITVLLLLSNPKRIPFALHALTLFIVIRSAFTLMTHLGPPEAFYISDFGESINQAFFGADQFFSGHTGMPLLGALAFWHKPFWRNLFLCGTLYFAAIVLLGHIHYSIDVASAFFITYGIYHLALWLFPREYALFRSAD